MTYQAITPDDSAGTPAVVPIVTNFQETIPEESLGTSKELSKLIADGPIALNSLFGDLREHLKKMIAARLDRRLLARVDASDIVQEAYVRALQGLPGYLNSPNVHPIIWLRLIGKHLVAETHRRHFRAKRSPDTEVNFNTANDDFFVNQIADSMQSVHSAVAKEELVRKVRELIRDMPQQDREVLEMRHTDGLSIGRIAEMLEIQLDTAKKRYYRALDRFRKVAIDAIPNG